LTHLKYYTQSHKKSFDIDDDLRQKLAVLEAMSAEDILSRETWQITTEQTDKR
jgi:hypothetical protein